MYSKSWLRAGSLVLLVLCIALGGCGPGKGKGKVKGRVKYLDKYLNAGTVTFTTKDGRTDSANIDFEGNYEMVNAPVGEVTITVSVPKMPLGPTKGGPPQPPKDVGMKTAMGGGNTPTPSIDPGKIVQIPDKYEKVETSNLKFPVEKGEQTYNITLTP